MSMSIFLFIFTQYWGNSDCWVLVWRLPPSLSLLVVRYQGKKQTITTCYNSQYLTGCLCFTISEGSAGNGTEVFRFHLRGGVPELSLVSPVWSWNNSVKKSNSGVDTLAKYLVSGTCVVTAGGLLSGCVVGEWTLVGPRVDRSAGAPQTQAPTSSTPSPHSRLQVPAKRGQM